MAWNAFETALTKRSAPNKAQLQFALQEARHFKREPLESFLARFSVLVNKIYGEQYQWEEVVFHNVLRGIADANVTDRTIGQYKKRFFTN